MPSELISRTDLALAYPRARVVPSWDQATYAGQLFLPSWAITTLRPPLAFTFELLAGAKGAGKGTYLAGLAARVSRTANVLFASTEDSAEIDLKPRLVAAGAEMEQCFLIQQHIQLPADVDELRVFRANLVPIAPQGRIDHYSAVFRRRWADRSP